MDSNTQLGEIAPSTPPDVPQRALMDWHSITVTRMTDGTTRAFHNHLDLATRKLVTVQLGDPLAEAPRYAWHVLALLCAAEELEARWTGDHGL